MHIINIECEKIKNLSSIVENSSFFQILIDLDVVFFFSSSAFHDVLEIFIDHNNNEIMLITNDRTRVKLNIDKENKQYQSWREERTEQTPGFFFINLSSIKRSFSLFFRSIFLFVDFIFINQFLSFEN